MKKPLCLALFLCLLPLAGCAVLNPGPPSPQVVLNPTLPARSEAPALPQQITVLTPETGNALGTERIAAVFNGFEVRFLGDARWVAPIPWLLQRLLVDALDSYGRFAGVGDEMSGLSSQIRLISDVKRFNLSYPREGDLPTAEVAFTLRLVDMRTGRVLGSKSLSADEPANGGSPGHFVLAFNAALTRILPQITEWTASTVERSMKTEPAANTEKAAKPAK